MIEFYKYQTGLYNTSRPVFRPHSGRETRGHCKKIAKISNNTRIRSDFFSQRVITAWNELPEKVVTAPSLNSLKSRFDAHWANHPSIYDPDCYH